jgi:rRNA maturation endonuclease Nob1
MIPRTGFDDDPKFCPHCGHSIELVERMDLSEEMAELLPTIDRDEL